MVYNVERKYSSLQLTRERKDLCFVECYKSQLCVTLLNPDIASHVGGGECGLKIV